MKIGITGWRGFIGSHLKEALDDPVLFQGDMRNLDAVVGFVNSCDRIYHVAGKNRAKIGAILANNLLSTGNLMIAATQKEVEPEIIFISSKQAEYNPSSEYGLTKLAEEAMVERVGKWSIYRVPNVYGPGGKPFYNSVVATFAYQIAHNMPVKIYDPEDKREFIHIDDLVKSLLEPHPSRYIDMQGTVMSVIEVYEYLTSRLGEHPRLKECLDCYKEVKHEVSIA